ncbi:MAG: hypothetical protein Q4G28_01955 [Neisseria sp.]|nr:hypothetical protein [Neisseria sp.]
MAKISRSVQANPAFGGGVFCRLALFSGCLRQKNGGAADNVHTAAVAFSPCFPDRLRFHFNRHLTQFYRLHPANTDALSATLSGIRTFFSHASADLDYLLINLHFSDFPIFTYKQLLESPYFITPIRNKNGDLTRFSFNFVEINGEYVIFNAKLLTIHYKSGSGSLAAFW